MLFYKRYFVIWKRKVHVCVSAHLQKHQNISSSNLNTNQKWAYEDHKKADLGQI